MSKIILEGYFHNFYYYEHALKYEILMKMINRKRKIENILSNLK